MGIVLIAMPKSDDALRFKGLIQGYGMMLDTMICSTGSEILRIANDRDFGVVICTKRLRDMEYLELSEYLPPTFGMIVLTKDASVEMFSERMVKLMVPMKGAELISTIEMLASGYMRPRKKKEKPSRVKSEAEKQVIEKAKLLLMDRNGMSEPEAFRYIQKVSMDTGRKAGETAEMILALNES